MIKNKNILVVGGGNAGRPVANLLNFLGNNVVVNDINTIEKFPKESQKQINILKERNIKFELGSHEIIDLNSFDHVFISPNIPEQNEFIRKIRACIDDGKLAIINFKDFGSILNSLINIPIIGITGSDGKTTITNMINFILEEKFNTLLFSSIEKMLVIEGLVELIVNSDSENFVNNSQILDYEDDECVDEDDKDVNEAKKSKNRVNEKNRINNELGIFELPHGTIRLVEGLKLSAAIITNLNPDHMNEFTSYKEYINRHIVIDKLINKNGILMVNGDDPILSSRLNSFSSKILVYGLKLPQKIEFEDEVFYNEDVEYHIFGKDIKLNGLNGSKFTVKSNGFDTLICKNCNKINCSCDNFEPKTVEPFEREISTPLPGIVNVENIISTLTSALVFGLDLDYAIPRIETFKGLIGRFERIDKVDGIDVFIDAGHNPESFERVFKDLNMDGNLIISLENPDTSTIRDKRKIGEIISKNCDKLVISAKNEVTGDVEYDNAIEILKGAGKIDSYVTDSIQSSLFKALEIANSGDTIFHMGPGSIVTNCEFISTAVVEAINFYKSLQGKIVVIGGCGTVGSLIARILKSYNYDVTVSDLDEKCKLKEVFNEEDINLSLGELDKELLGKASSFFIAPSLKNNVKIVNSLKKMSDAPIYSVEEILKFFKAHKPVIGVTGTNGKTSTVNFLKSILKESGLEVPEHKMNIQGNNEFIPALQARLNGDLAVIEVGTFGNKGEIKTQSENSQITTGIITNISKDHIHKDFKDYISCKKEIIEVTRNLILNGDDPILSNFIDLEEDNKFRGNGKLLFFGVDGKSIDENFKDFFRSAVNKRKKCPKCSEKLFYSDDTDYSCLCGFKKPKLDVIASDIKIAKNDNDENIITYTLNIGENKGKIFLKNSSIVNVYNSLAAATGALLEETDFENIVKGINSFEGVPGRFEILHKNPLIILDYAHNPAGVKSIIQGVLAIKEDLNSKTDESETNNYSKLIIVNTISSESGDEGDKEIAQLLSDGDIIIPASNKAHDFSIYVQSKVVHLKDKSEFKKVNTTGATKEQVEEGIEIALNQSNTKDIILIIGEAGVKYSKNVLSCVF
ncbi:MAG: hypothetical protein LBD03_01850 [Methanobrevibacter sp.]|jgi:UDP-N-acetylmuramoylalanine-D-glutamate ligase|nr:hypothetical protein [Candidatus Methanovirga procula]